MRSALPPHRRHRRARLPVALALAAAALAAALAPSGASGSLQSQLQATMSAQQLLRAAIRGDTAKITGFQGRVDDLQQQQAAVQSALDAETASLATLKDRLRASRSHLLELRHKEARDLAALARALRAQYESDPPSLVNVVLSARGFSDLLESVDAMRAVSRRNAAVADAVIRARRATATEARRLAFLTARQQRIAAAMLSQRDQIARLKLSVLSRQMVYVHARDAKSTRLQKLSSRAQTLQRQIAAIQAREARLATPDIAVGGAVTGDSGSYGFFPAAGTNYSVGDEPTIAERLSAMGKALHLHLVGISGYRTPAHSVEVGGFANDPHTRGQASDTAGVEGIPESTLNQFGLTRPFGGARELNHVQLLGSA
ncbi:MAG TPA: hypothetical protein VHB30_04545 [Solirubrobacteraceae bacterium]|jgi:peptidoglycan hydrolase CwlO-like protein|nr:hypothetical protein [Solirubrobacteraceae bacterium]